MKTLGELLRKHIEQSGFNIYQFARRSGIHRVNIQRYIANQRTPAPEVFASLVSHLQLQPQERQELETSYEIARVGRELYFQRLSVKELVESLALIYENEEQLESYCQGLPGNFPDSFPSREERKTCVISGFMNVAGLFRAELRRSALALPGSSVFLFLPPDPRHAFMNAWISPITPPQENFALKITQIFPLTKANAGSGSQNHNLRVLSTLLPPSLSRHFQYQAYFYYDDPLNDQNYGLLYPYYGIFEDCVMLFSQDMESGFLSFDPALVQLYQTQFQKRLIHCQKLLGTDEGDRVFPEPEPLSQLQESPLSLYHLSYYPCLTPLEAARSFGITHYQYFTPQGLTRFALSGSCGDAFSLSVKADSPDCRRSFLRRLREMCEEDVQILRIINPEVFSIPAFLNLQITPEAAFLWNFRDHSSWNRISIRESGIRSAFADFLSSLLESPYVYSKAQTLALLEEAAKRI